MSTEETLAISDYVAAQDELVKEAGLALPNSFSQCTYALGPLRQAVYLCLTCPEIRGLCSACSTACHTTHTQVELFPKRNFRCDCPTSAVQHACTLHTALEPPNAGNTYGQNFENKFCRCGRAYDARVERETMVQCLACEDWFHESCCMLRTRPEPEGEPESVQPESESSGQSDKGSDAAAANTDANANATANVEVDDAASDASSSGLPPPLISADDYDAFVCRTCVRRIPTLQRVVGTPGAITVVRAEVGAPWTRLGDETAESSTEVVDVNVNPDANTGEKRPLLATEDQPAAKRPRTELASKPCLAPPAVANVQDAYANDKIDWETTLCTGDVFLTEDFRKRWCRCDSCIVSLEANPFLLEEEETYEPPEDPDSGLSLEELGMRALERLPRDRAIDGIMAFNSMRDKLRSYLQPFAEQGKVVGAADVQSFFEELRETAGTSGNAVRFDFNLGNNR